MTELQIFNYVDPVLMTWNENSTGTQASQCISLFICVSFVFQDLHLRICHCPLMKIWKKEAEVPADMSGIDGDAEEETEGPVNIFWEQWWR